MSHEDRPIEPAVSPVDESFNGGRADVAVEPTVASGQFAAPGKIAVRAPIPFVWQHDTRVLLLDDDEDGWVMAELRFDPEACRYQEIRRATYRLTREAIGAVLSRALASGDHAAVDTAIQLHQWLHTYYGISVIPDIIASPDARSVEFRR